ncbi:MAG: class I SAM-dependent methyltransferase [Chloroflexi bacterium]|nr:class I SAM-dependent methyltransferase [Chloroflexota bacterium]
MRPCPLCGQRDDLPSAAAGRARGGGGGDAPWVACRGCGLLLRDAPPGPFVDHCGEEYFAPTSAELLAHLRRRAAGRLQKVSRYRRGGRLLEVGCGAGEFLEACAAQGGWEVQGIEPSPAGAAPARARGLDVTCAPLEDVALPSAAFDVVVAWHVLEHLWDPLAALQQLGATLRADGMLFLEVPNASCLGARLFRQQWISMASPGHTVLFTARTLGALLARAGFRVFAWPDPTGADLVDARYTIAVSLRARVQATFPGLLGHGAGRPAGAIVPGPSLGRPWSAPLRLARRLAFRSATGMVFRAERSLGPRPVLCVTAARATARDAA